MLPRLMHLLRGERIRLTSKHDKATKQVINASSCVLFCCLSKLYREVECFTTKLWKQTAPAYTASIPAAAMQCLLHSPPKITEGLIKYLHFFCLSPTSGQSWFSPFEYGPGKAMETWKKTCPGLQSEHQQDQRTQICFLGRRKLENNHEKCHSHFK